VRARHVSIGSAAVRTMDPWGARGAGTWRLPRAAPRGRHLPAHQRPSYGRRRNGFTNITDLRARERELSDLVDKLPAARDEATHWRSRLTEAIEAGSEGFALHGHDDRLVLCNSYFRRLYHPYEEAIREGVSFGELCDKVIEGNLVVFGPDGPQT